MILPNPPASVRDPGTVRLGAGMRRPAAPLPSPAPVAVPAGTAALVADPGTVRLGAGMRRNTGERRPA